jgi:anti-sigma factor RsiW
MRGCPDQRTLIAFAQDDLAQDTVAAVERHLEACDRCAKALARLKTDDDLIARIRDLEQARAGDEFTSRLVADIEDRTTTTLFGERPPRSAG